MEIMLFWLTSAMTEVVNSFPGMRSNMEIAYNVCTGIVYNVCLVTHIHPGLQDRIYHTDLPIPYPIYSTTHGSAIHRQSNYQKQFL